MRIAPTFFRSQPGRRFAAEPQRATALMLGFDVPTRITRHRGAAARRRASTRQLCARDVVISRAGGYRFVEERELRSGGGGSPSAHRAAPRVEAADHARLARASTRAVAADLRRVDGAEQEEIRIRARRDRARGGR